MYRINYMELNISTKQLRYSNLSSFRGKIQMYNFCDVTWYNVVSSTTQPAHNCRELPGFLSKADGRSLA